jgi:acyl-CoA synthetase (NDP forming)
LLPAADLTWQALSRPQSLAIVGSSKNPRKWGFNILLHTLEGGYSGRIYPVNPREKEILGLKVFPDMTRLPEPVDLVLLVVPPSDILKVLNDCGQSGAKVGIVITAGFGEMGEQGKRIEKEMVTLARGLGMRLMGPNCQGMVSPECSLYAHMPAQFPKRGELGVVTQSGNLATSFQRLGESMGLGFSRVISSGNEADLQTTDFLEFLAGDKETKVILSYLEGIKEGRDFRERISRIISQKPLIMIKAGQTAAGIKAVQSHTGSLSGADALYQALFQQLGIIRGETLEELLDMASALTTQPLPKGRRVGIITTGGGWGVLAADHCAKAGLIVEDLPPGIIQSLDQVLPPWWNRINPVDMVTGYRKGDLLETLELFFKAREFDGILLLGMGWRTFRGSYLKSVAKGSEDPMFALGQEWIEEESKLFLDLQEMGQQYQKPILLASDAVHFTPGFQEAIAKRRVAAYPSPQRAIRAYLGLVKRAEFLDRSSIPKIPETSRP